MATSFVRSANTHFKLQRWNLWSKTFKVYLWHGDRGFSDWRASSAWTTPHLGSARVPTGDQIISDVDCFYFFHIRWWFLFFISDDDCFYFFFISDDDSYFSYQMMVAILFFVVHIRWWLLFCFLLFISDDDCCFCFLSYEMMILIFHMRWWLLFYIRWWLKPFLVFFLLNPSMPKRYFCTSKQFIVFKKQMLQAANSDLFNP